MFEKLLKHLTNAPVAVALAFLLVGAPAAPVAKMLPSSGDVYASDRPDCPVGEYAINLFEVFDGNPVPGLALGVGWVCVPDWLRVGCAAQGMVNSLDPTRYMGASGAVLRFLGLSNPIGAAITGGLTGVAAFGKFFRWWHGDRFSSTC